MNLEDFLNEGGIFPEGQLIIKKIKAPKADLKWLHEGYAVEFIEIDGDREVISFLNTGEFVLPSRPDSHIESIGSCEILSISWEKLLMLTRECPKDVFGLHKVIRANHREKIKNYREGLKTKTIIQRYYELLENMPWVKQVADPDDIASYLQISPEQYQKLTVVE